MANITEVSQWESVIRQIENGEAATGGADGLANVQAKQLANRTTWLKGNLAPIINAAFSGTLKHENNDLAGSAIVAVSYKQNGYIRYANGLTLMWGEMYSGENKFEITLPISCSNIFVGIAYDVVTTSIGKTTESYVRSYTSNDIGKLVFKRINVSGSQSFFCETGWFAIGA